MEVGTCDARPSPHLIDTPISIAALFQNQAEKYFNPPDRTHLNGVILYSIIPFLIIVKAENTPISSGVPGRDCAEIYSVCRVLPCSLLSTVELPYRPRSLAQPS
jgi:hypothetical protein